MLAKINRNYVPAYWDDFFNDSFFRNVNQYTCNSTSPAVNVAEEDKAFRIEVAVPGLTREDIRIDLENDVLTIASEEKKSKEEKNFGSVRREFNYSTFKRSFQLPETIDLDHIKATQESGILTIELPKKDEVVQKAPKQIEIK
ncbi:MAG: Hsp20/alpha crystallin family protein [Bacteroidota bacterium]